MSQNEEKKMQTISLNIGSIVFFYILFFLIIYVRNFILKEKVEKKISPSRATIDLSTRLVLFQLLVIAIAQLRLA